MRKILKPADARTPVPKPEGGYLDADGELISMTVYWRRRLGDGSVQEVPPAVEPEITTEIQPPARRRRSKKE